MDEEIKDQQIRPEDQQPKLTEEQKHMLIRNYFATDKAEFPSTKSRVFLWSVVLILSGIVIIAYFKTNYITVISGTAVFFIGILFGYKWLAPYYADKKRYSLVPESEEMDIWLIEDIKTEIKPYALAMLTLDATKINPENFIIIPYPIYWESPGFEEGTIKRKISDEGHFKYSAYKIQILALAENYISLYSCNYDWINNEIISQSTNEFFFEDVSSIRNDVELLNYKLIGSVEGDEITAGKARVFSIMNMSGESLSIITDIPALMLSPRLSVNIDKIIQVLRLILRNRRFGEILEVVRPQDEENDQTETEETR